MGGGAPRANVQGVCGQQTAEVSLRSEKAWGLRTHALPSLLPLPGLSPGNNYNSTHLQSPFQRLPSPRSFSPSPEDDPRSTLRSSQRLPHRSYLCTCCTPASLHGGFLLVPSAGLARGSGRKGLQVSAGFNCLPGPETSQDGVSPDDKTFQ